MQFDPPTEAHDDSAIQTRLDQLAVERTLSESIGKQE
jgi:hypothetical protein